RNCKRGVAFRLNCRNLLHDEFQPVQLTHDLALEPQRQSRIRGTAQRIQTVGAEWKLPRSAV
ncbi:MAG: hypothetical protein RQ966_20305, partial [Acetobacteraceae bacterium]|nr:hypothetical protein [Acetobacteraceae bacterium]